MDVGAGEQGGDGYLAVGDVEVQLIPSPELLVSIGGFFDSYGAPLRQPGDHFRNLHLALTLENRSTGCGFCPWVLAGLLLRFCLFLGSLGLFRRRLLAALGPLLFRDALARVDRS